jgi:hypothetical protein
MPVLLSTPASHEPPGVARYGAGVFASIDFRNAVT